MLYGTDTEFVTTSMRHLLKDHLVLLGAASLFIFFLQIELFSFWLLEVTVVQHHC